MGIPESKELIPSASGDTMINSARRLRRRMTRVSDSDSHGSGGVDFNNSLPSVHDVTSVPTGLDRATRSGRKRIRFEDDSKRGMVTSQVRCR